jgi:hypothetical protein
VKGFRLRRALFVSLALAAGTASFAASACDNRVDYSTKIDGYMKEYQVAVDTANKNYAMQNNNAGVRFYDTSLYSRPRGRQFIWAQLAYDEMLRYNLLVWSNSVNKAVEDYNRNVQDAYDNACIWW